MSVTADVALDPTAVRGELDESSIYVSADGLTCTHARRITREFRFGPRDRVGITAL
jgi:hypothetical protein